MELFLKEVCGLSDSIKNIDDKILETRINKVETDSRKVESGDLFIAIKGDNFDGHNFAESAVKSGAAAVVVHKKIKADIPQIIVKDTVLFLGKLAEYYKSKFNVITIAVTGSCGKTTTKDMINCVLKTKFNVVTNAGSFNNYIGVPLTVFKLKKSSEILLSETGMNHSGEIDYLSKIIKPDIAVITNVEPVHLEGLKSMKNIAKAKFELLKNLNKNGTVFLNWDNSFIRAEAKRFKFNAVKYGFSEGSDFTFKKYENVGGTYKVKYKDEFITSPLPGFHNVYNLLITCAIAEYFKIKAGQIKSALSKFEPSGRRLKVVKNKGVSIIDDCYNANPTSVSNAIKIMDDMQVKGKRYFVFGDMGELGNFAEKYHKSAGDCMLNSKIDSAVIMGVNAKHTFEKIKNKIDSIYVQTYDEAVNYLKTNLKKNDCVLIKASRFMKFENISSKLY